MPDSSIRSRIRENAGESSPTVAAFARMRARAASPLAFALALRCWPAPPGVYQITFSTPQGTFIVKIDSKDVEAASRTASWNCSARTASSVHPHVQRSQQTLPAGPYKIRVVGADGLTVDVPEFVMKNGTNHGTRCVEAPAVARTEPDAKKAAPDGKCCCPLRPIAAGQARRAAFRRRKLCLAAQGTRRVLGSHRQRHGAAATG